PGGTWVAAGREGAPTCGWGVATWAVLAGPVAPGWPQVGKGRRLAAGELRRGRSWPARWHLGGRRSGRGADLRLGSCDVGGPGRPGGTWVAAGREGAPTCGWGVATWAVLAGPVAPGWPQVGKGRRLAAGELRRGRSWPARWHLGGRRSGRGADLRLGSCDVGGPGRPGGTWVAAGREGAPTCGWGVATWAVLAGPVAPGWPQVGKGRRLAAGELRRGRSWPARWHLGGRR